MKAVLAWLSEHFGFSPRESRGFMIFFLCSVILFLASFWVPSWFSRNPQLNLNDSTIINAFLEDYSRLSAKQKPEAEIAVADPNEMNFYDWRNLGLDQKLINNIINFRLKGGQFRQIEDLKAIYGMNEEIFDRIAPFIKVTKDEKDFKRKNFKTNRNDFEKPDPAKYKGKIEAQLHKLEPFAINLADTSSLQKISGIGPARARRIVNFRDALGGFVSKNQLYEVYGLDSAIIEKVINSTHWDTLQVNKIQINDIDFKSLMKHPYFDYNMTKLIINYRDQHGRYKDENDLLNIKILDEAWMAKRRPYIDYR